MHNESQGQDQIEESEAMEGEMRDERQGDEQIMEDDMLDESQVEDRIEAIDSDQTRNLLTEGEEEDDPQIKEKITISDEDLMKCLMIGRNDCKPMHEKHFLN